MLQKIFLCVTDDGNQWKFKEGILARKEKQKKQEKQEKKNLFYYKRIYFKMSKRFNGRNEMFINFQ
jgi:hypothetical protein